MQGNEYDYILKLREKYRVYYFQFWRCRQASSMYYSEE